MAALVLQFLTWRLQCCSNKCSEPKCCLSWAQPCIAAGFWEFLSLSPSSGHFSCSSRLSVFRYTAIQIPSVYVIRTLSLHTKEEFSATLRVFSELDEGGKKPSGKHMWNNHQPVILWREWRANEEECMDKLKINSWAGSTS